jgi:uncharacterized protein (TIGR03435 family)
VHRWLVTVGIVTMIAAMLAGQQPGPTFEITSVKRHTSDELFGTAGPQPGGRFVMVNLPVVRLIRAAYPNLTASQIAGAPEWVNTERYDITAMVGRDVTATEMEGLLRRLLLDRFTFKAHFESRDQDAFALVRVAQRGALPPQLQRVTNDCTRVVDARAGATSDLPRATNGAPACGLVYDGQKLVAGGITMAQLARNLTPLVGRVAVDRTGLAGYYEFTLEYAAVAGNAAGVPDANDPRPSIFGALQQQLGLRLESQRIPVDVLVIDSVERPTPD